MNNKYKLPLIFILLAVLAVAAYFIYKDKYGNPESGLRPRIEMGVGRIDNLTDSTLDLTLNLLIHNPLPVGLNAEDFDYYVQMDGDTIIKNTYGKPLNIKSRDSTTLELPSRVFMGRLKAANAKAPPESDSADYEFTAVFNLFEKIVGKEAINVSIDRRLPRYRLPVVEMMGYELEKFGLKESEVVIKLRFVNNNPFKIRIKDPSYEVDLGKQNNLAKGSLPGVIPVNGRSEHVFEIPLSLDMGDLLKATGQLIRDGKELPFSLDFRCTLESENKMMDDAGLALSVEGTLGELSKAKDEVAK